MGVTLTEETLALRPYLPQPGLRPTAGWALVSAAIAAHGGGSELSLADPMCGHGVALIEAALHWPSTVGRCIGADLDRATLVAAAANIAAAGCTGVQLLQKAVDDDDGWQKGTGACDLVVCDPPFGQKHPADIEALYPVRPRLNHRGTTLAISTAAPPS